MLNLNTLIPDSNNPFYKIKYPLVSEEEKQKAGIVSEYYEDFENGLKNSMHEKMAKTRDYVDKILKIPRNEKIPKLEYPEDLNWETVWEKIITADKRTNPFFGLKIDELNRIIGNLDDRKKRFLNYMLAKIKNGNNDINFNFLRILLVADLIKSEKEIYIIGQLFDFGIIVDTSDQFFLKEIINIDIFDKVLSAFDKLKSEKNCFGLDEIIKCYKVIQNYGENFLDLIIKASNKIGKTPDSVCPSSFNQRHLFDHILNDPYICEIIGKLSSEDIENTSNILRKINFGGVLSFPEFIYFSEIISKNKDVLKEPKPYREYLGSNVIFTQDNPFYKIILYEVYGGDKVAMKESIVNSYIEGGETNLSKMTEYFEIKNSLSASELQELYFSLAPLRFLFDKPDFQKFIKENFVIQDIDDLGKIMKIILDNRTDPQFEMKIEAVKNLQKTILKDNSGKINNLEFFRLYQIREDLSFSPQFIDWLGTLYRKTGFNYYEALSYGYLDSKIPALKKWHENPKVFLKAISLGILGGKMDDQSKEYSSNIYGYNNIEQIINNPELLKFLQENSDINLLETVIKKNTDKNIALEWFNNKEIFYQAKNLGIFAPNIYKNVFGKLNQANNLDKFDVISGILKDTDFLQFLKDNEDLNFLQEAINSDYGFKKSGYTESIKGWYKNPTLLAIAKRIGILGDKLGIENSNIYNYKKLVCLNELNEEQIIELIKIFDSGIDKNFLISNLERIITFSHTNKSLYRSAFAICVYEGVLDDGRINNFPVTKDNFGDYLLENEPLIYIEKDRGLVGYPIPWSKEWFNEDKNRLTYLNKDTTHTFMKFGTNIALALLEGTKNIQNFIQSYEGMVNKITRENERSTILQLGEIFSLVISNGNFNFFDQILCNENNVGNTFKEFVEEHKISNKGKTILTLLFAREVNTAHQGGLDENIKTITKNVFEKLKKYNSVINKYKQENIPKGLRTSIGMEYEVTNSIAKGYSERTMSDYKKDIEILSCYSGIAKGNDSIHEIATKPTDNPYLLLLELKLLNDLDFVDLNFEKHMFQDTDYSKGSRSFHITLGGEYGIEYNRYADYIQNILVASNLGGINAQNLVRIVNKIINIRDKGSDCEAIFNDKNTPVTEYRSLSIDQAESFERCVVSIFNLNMAKQAIEKYTFINKGWIEKLTRDKISNLEDFKSLCESRNYISKKIEDPKIWLLIYDFVKLQIKILNTIKDNNENFINNETFNEYLSEDVSKAFNLLRVGLIDGGKMGKVFAAKYLINFLEDFKYMQELSESFPIEEELFYERLQKDGKIRNEVPSSKKKLLYKWFKKYFAEPTQLIKTNNPILYSKLGIYLSSDNIAKLDEKMQNKKRFEEIIKNNPSIKATSIDEYLKEIQMDPDNFYKQIDPEFVNTLTKINNLFLKPPSGISSDAINASAVFNSTVEIDKNGNKVTKGDLDASKRTIFDCIDRDKSVRKGRYIIQGSSDKMLINEIQQAILDFNKEIEEIITN